MSDSPKARFYTFLQQASAEYEHLWAAVASFQSQNDGLSPSSKNVKAPSLPTMPEGPPPMLPGVCLDSMEASDIRKAAKSTSLQSPPAPTARHLHPTIGIQVESPPKTPIDSTPLATPRPPTPVALVHRYLSKGESKGALGDPEEVRREVQRMELEAEVVNQTGSLLRSSTRTLTKRLGTAEFDDTGWTASIVKSKSWEVLTLTLILLNALWIGIDADFNSASILLEADPIFIVMDNLFCFLFTLELILRWIAVKSRRVALRDPWFIFDAILVLSMIIETWVMTLAVAVANSGSLKVNISALRLLKLVRLMRVSRIIRAVPELSFMVKALLEATRSVACTISLLIGVLYVFGIALRQLSVDTEMGETYFSSVVHAMFTLFTQGTLLDGITDIMEDVYEESLSCLLLFLAVVFLGALTLMNMLVGVLCEVMMHVAQHEKDHLARTLIKEQLQMTLEEIDSDNDGFISKEEFVHMICCSKATQALKNAGVDVVALVDFADYFFQSDRHGEAFEEKWSFDRFMEEVMRVRGLNQATVRDIVELRKALHSDNTYRNAMLKHIQDNLITLSKNQSALERHVTTPLATRSDHALGRNNGAKSNYSGSSIVAGAGA